MIKTHTSRLPHVPQNGRLQAGGQETSTFREALQTTSPGASVRSQGEARAQGRLFLGNAWPEEEKEAAELKEEAREEAAAGPSTEGLSSQRPKYVETNGGAETDRNFRLLHGGAGCSLRVGLVRLRRVRSRDDQQNNDTPATHKLVDKYATAGAPSSKRILQDVKRCWAASTATHTNHLLQIRAAKGIAVAGCGARTGKAAHRRAERLGRETHKESG